MRALLLLLMAIACDASAKEWRLLDLEEFSFEGYHLADHRDADYPYDSGPELWKAGSAVNFDLDLLKKGDYGLVWENTVRGEATDRQYRGVNWEYEIGLDLGSKVRLFWHHKSEHLLDERADTHFPLYNIYGARIIFYKRGDK